jgi:hypothetical protein|tara:strand:+ start:797 stop:952 length:156 start_codon:yes stop_codon:yes gene_type:complete
MSSAPDDFAVSKRCPELYEIFKRIFDGSFYNIRITTEDFYARSKEKDNKNV